MTTTVNEHLYEGMFLVDSAKSTNKDWPTVEAHIQEIISKHGGSLVYSEKWPDRRLAYELKGCKKGTYYLTYFNAPSDSIDKMKREVTLSEHVLRVLFIQEEGLDKEMEGRKNKEIEIPPADLSIGKERTFDSSGRGGGRGGRGGGGGGGGYSDDRGGNRQRDAAPEADAGAASEESSEASSEEAKSEK